MGAVLFRSDVDNFHGWTERAGAEGPQSSRVGHLEQLETMGCTVQSAFLQTVIY